VAVGVRSYLVESSTKDIRSFALFAYNFGGQPCMTRRIILFGTIAIMFAYAVVAYHFWDQVRSGYSDFISFYTAGKILQQGAAERLYDLKLQYDIQREYAPTVNIRAGALPYVRPAFEAWLFVPFARLHYQTAFLLWDFVSIILLIAITVLARSQIPGLQQIPFILLISCVLSYFPVFIMLLQGQDSALLLLVFFLAYLALRAGNETRGGMLLGLGTFKFPLVIPFMIPFLLAKRVRLLTGFFLTSLLLLGISAFTTGLRSFSTYPNFLLSIDQLARGVNDPRAMPNIRGLVSVVLGSHVSLTTLNCVVVVVSLFVVGWLAAKHRLFVPDGGRLFALAFSLNLVVTILVSYHAHVFDLVLLLPFLAISTGRLLSPNELAPWSQQLLSTAVGLVLFSPLYFVLSLLSRYTTVLALILIGACFALSRTIMDLECSSSVATRVAPAHLQR
jgi:Glycosyltransferase family 87